VATFHVLLGRNFATIGSQMQAFSAGFVIILQVVLCARARTSAGLEKNPAVTSGENDFVAGEGFNLRT